MAANAGTISSEKPSATNAPPSRYKKYRARRASLSSLMRQHLTDHANGRRDAVRLLPGLQDPAARTAWAWFAPVSLRVHLGAQTLVA